MSSIHAISPIDGRYSKITHPLHAYFSESALIKYRIKVEIEYIKALGGLQELGEDAIKLSAAYPLLINWFEHISDEEILRVKEIEKTTNHDVKAVEYILKEVLTQVHMEDIKEWVHFGLTSQDINNTAIPLSLKEANEDILIPQLENLLGILSEQADQWKGQAMLARTHGQPASPTVLGKEWIVFISRIQGQLSALKGIPHKAKFGGATGNFNAHHIAYPEIDWIAFAQKFISEQLGLERTLWTTQIEPYDTLAAHLDAWKRICTILIDFSRDVWTYISMDYFKQKITKGEVGSSAMPHKVNPIDFENAEGNLGIAVALLEHLSHKLPISRLQRDLTDSTVLRNLGVPMAHILISLKSIEKGLGKLILHTEKINADLASNWAVVAEAIQTVLRREKYPNPYEALKELTRQNNEITQESIHDFIDQLDVNQSIKNELKKISPSNYIGIIPSR
jgi:adenylosuccinate lyase